MDSQRFNLARGGITRKLLLVSLPIVGGNLMLMGYNLVDMFLLGRVGADAVASSGSAGMYMWLAGGLMIVGKIGAEIGVAQKKGKGDTEGAKLFARNALAIAFALGLAVAAAFILAPETLVRFLNIQEPHVAQDAVGYLGIVGWGIPPLFVSAAAGGIFTGAGNSRAPFIVNAAGLALNGVLDPLFIFTLGMGVRGAAIATALALWAIAALILHMLLAGKNRPFPSLSLRARPDAACLRQILRWTIPVSLENMLFTTFAMIVARQVAVYGANAITVSRIGSQVESLCWITCLGFSSGITAFVGQNFGAGSWTRIRRGLRTGLLLITGWGVLTTTLFLTSGKWLTSLFVPEEPIVTMGGDYLWILAFCQIALCVEAVAAGGFRGLGRTTPPSIVSIATNALRVPAVHILSATTFGLNGVWIGVTLTALVRGVWVTLWFRRHLRAQPTADTRPSVRTTATLPPSSSVRLLP